jgi:hypothetical protein
MNLKILLLPLTSDPSNLSLAYGRQAVKRREG